MNEHDCVVPRDAVLTPIHTCPDCGQKWQCVDLFCISGLIITCPDCLNKILRNIVDKSNEIPPSQKGFDAWNRD